MVVAVKIKNRGNEIIVNYAIFMQKTEQNIFTKDNLSTFL
jgi:hypothetical protein